MFLMKTTDKTNDLIVLWGFYLLNVFFYQNVCSSTINKNGTSSACLKMKAGENLFFLKTTR